MRRLAALLAALLLAAGALPARAEETDTESTVFLQQVVAAGGQAYAMDSVGGVYWVDTKTRQPVLLGSFEPSQYATTEAMLAGVAPPASALIGGDQLYAVCELTGRLYRVLDESGAFAPEVIATLPLSPYTRVDSDYGLSAVSVSARVVQDDSLWLLLPKAGGDALDNLTTCVRFPLDGSAPVVLPREDISDISAYRDHRLLCLFTPKDGGYNPETGAITPPDYGFVSTQTGEVQQVGPIKKTESDASNFSFVTRLYWCQSAQTAYFFDATQITGLDLHTGAGRVSAYTGTAEGYATADMMCVADGPVFVQLEGGEVIVRPLDLQSLKAGALTVSGTERLTAHTAFLKEHPEVPMQVSTAETSSISALSQAMVSGNDSVDVMLLTLSTAPMAALQQKGYCYELGGSAELKEYVAALYPAFQSAAYRGDKLLCVPVSLSCYGLGVNAEVWQRLGLTQADVPASLDALLDFLIAYPDRYMNDYPDVRIFTDDDLRQTLYGMLRSMYILYYQHAGQTLAFDTPLYRGLLQKLSAIDYAAFQRPAGDDAWQSPQLFTHYYGYSEPSGYQSDSEWPMALSLTADTPVLLQAEVGALILNPRTRRYDQAMQYITYLCQHLDAEREAITLRADASEAVPDASAIAFHDGLLQEIEKAELKLQNAAPEDRAAQEDILKAMRNTADSVGKQLEKVRLVDIQHYRADIAPLMVAKQLSIIDSVGTAGQAELDRLYSQYVSGAIPLDRYIAQLQTKIWMMEQEQKP